MTSEPPRLLIVDDDPLLRKLMVQLAERSGAYSSVESAPDGAEGLELIWAVVNENRLDRLPHVIVSDLRMPVVDGVALTKSLKSCVQTAHIPVVMVTSSVDDRDRVRAIASGCHSFHSKPDSPRAMRQFLAELPSALIGAAGR
jgi:CheY-like chemotaxis protein